MAALFRDAPIGQFIRLVTKNRYLHYPEEKPNFKIPESWIWDTRNGLNPSMTSNVHVGTAGLPQAGPNNLTELRGLESALSHEDGIDRIPSSYSTSARQVNADRPIIVNWYGDQDAENPHNWSNRKRAVVTMIICVYTFVVYASSAIYTSSTGGVMAEFGVNQLEATLGLSIYVLGYGVGPLIFSPLSEIPLIGRNPVYIITMIIFVIISIPTAFAPTFKSLIALRFLQGFFGSPCLASGGASLGDLYSMASCLMLC